MRLEEQEALNQTRLKAPTSGPYARKDSGWHALACRFRNHTRHTATTNGARATIEFHRHDKRRDLGIEISESYQTKAGHTRHYTIGITLSPENVAILRDMIAQIDNQKETA